MKIVKSLVLQDKLNIKIFLSPASGKTSLIEMVLLSTHNMFFG